MDDLVTWLREQIAAKESTARAAAEHEGQLWEVRPDGAEAVLWGYMRVASSADPGSVEPAVAAHITDNQPRAVLAQCEAHGRIIDQCEQDWVDNWSAAHALAQDVLRALALAYQHRDGYRSEWKP